jgi:uncharacterized membrane protein YgcG
VKRLLTFLVFLFAAADVRAVEAEQIYQFDSWIEVLTNGMLSVTETIRVQASGAQIRHGIYRDFPQLYQSPGGLRMKTGFAVQKVLRDGQAEDCHLADRENGTRVYIGSATSEVLPGVHTYELTYTTDRQLGFFRDHDELYWNVTGNGWVFPMNNVRATVMLPPGAKVKNLTAYTGPQGARGRDFTATNLVDRASFTTTRRLWPTEGLTIVVEWPKGFVTPPSVFTKWLSIFKDNRGLALCAAGCLLALAYYLVSWKLVGRDPRRGVVIPRYAPPADFSPAAVRYLWRMGYDNKTFTAAVMNMAVSGAIKIVERKEGIFRKRTFTLLPVPRVHANLSPAENIVRRELVGDGLPLTLRREYYATLQAAQNKLREYLAEQIQGRFFKHNITYSVLGILFCIASIVALVLDSPEPGPMAFLTGFCFVASLLFIAIGHRMQFVAGIILAAVALVAVGVAVKFLALPVLLACLPLALGTLAGFFHYLLKAYTPEGRQIMDEIEGFKMYLSVAEKDRLNLENPPERTPQLFEMFLPYALALGVEQKWSEQFAGVLAAAGAAPDQKRYSPTWYSGDSWSQTTTTGFAAAFSSSLAGAISSASTAPGSSSGGGGDGGGGGGGGSSGGGGGGGGGGGW